jgi:hypothetical protein
MLLKAVAPVAERLRARPPAAEPVETGTPDQPDHRSE